MTAEHVLLILFGIIVGGTVTKLIELGSKLKDIITELGVIKTALGNIFLLSAQTNKAVLANLQASENFVDALRESAGMMSPPFSPSDKDEFKDLRKKFEDGIDNLQDDENSDDSDDTRWKK
jgi:hypothetical protein